MNPLRIALIPRDGLFCKDGRGWHTSSSGRGHALDWPWPSTVLGALRTSWGREEEARLGRRFDRDDWLANTRHISLGATIALRRTPGAGWSRSHRVWPVPADALWLEGRSEVLRLDPRPHRVPTLGIDDDAAREALWFPSVDDAAKPLRGPRWWSEEHMAAWLTEAPVSARQAAWLERPRRVQSHVGIQPDTLTADEGVLFSHDVVETLEPGHEWAIGVSIYLDGAWSPTVATVGSDGRLARIEQLPEQVFEVPGQLIAAFQGGCRGLRLFVVSPAEFEHGWRPDGFVADGTDIIGRLPGVDAELILRAAFVPRPVHVSGWDMAANGGRGAPKQTSRMVPAGAVYFFERRDGRDFTDKDVRRLWLCTLGRRTDEGFGRVVPGTWSSVRRDL